MLNQNGKNQDTPATPWTPAQAQPRSPEEILAEAKALVEQLEKQTALARGTHKDVREVLPKVAPLEVRIEQILRTSVKTTAELAKAAGETKEKVAAWIKSNRAKLADIGTPVLAKWVWRLGDEGPAKELQAMVQRIITETPMTTAELVQVTGARMARVNGVLVEICRNPEIPIYNEGSDFRARWHILPAHAKRANYQPKAPKPKK